jgi:hypothetical protein
MHIITDLTISRCIFSDDPAMNEGRSQEFSKEAVNVRCSKNNVTLFLCVVQGDYSMWCNAFRTCPLYAI